MPPTPDHPAAADPLERRAARGLTLKGRTIVGRAIVFDSPSGVLAYLGDDGTRRAFRETIAPGALDATLAGAPDVRALVEHLPYRIVGRTTAGTLRLTPTPEGLDVEIDPPRSTIGADLVESVERGDLDAMSFGFTCDQEEWTAADADGVEERRILALTLHEVSAVAWPAYEATTLSVRSLARRAATLAAPPAADSPAAPRRPLSLALARLRLTATPSPG
jgi:uncharacterized protein